MFMYVKARCFPHPLPFHRDSSPGIADLGLQGQDPRASLFTADAPTIDTPYNGSLLCKRMQPVNKVSFGLAIT